MFKIALPAALVAGVLAIAMTSPVNAAEQKPGPARACEIPLTERISSTVDGPGPRLTGKNIEAVVAAYRRSRYASVPLCQGERIRFGDTLFKGTETAVSTSETVSTESKRRGRTVWLVANDCYTEAAEMFFWVVGSSVYARADTGTGCGYQSTSVGVRACADRYSNSTGTWTILEGVCRPGTSGTYYSCSNCYSMFQSTNDFLCATNGSYRGRSYGRVSKGGTVYAGVDLGPSSTAC